MLAGLFLGSLTMLNILGVTRFVDLSFTVAGLEVPFVLAVGVLPYPITFLCTDFISELYGRKRANTLVWVGLLLNVWVVLILWLGGALPGFEATGADGELLRDAAGRLPVFYEVQGLALGAVTASMVAYLAAQFVDVQLFHFWKRLTRGKHLWLRNNGSTLASQLIDSVAVILITFYVAEGIPRDPSMSEVDQLMMLILSSYIFKFVAALIDTVPFYFGVRWLSRWLQIDPNEEHHDWERRGGDDGRAATGVT